jgi:quercetin dioxygenase-like cupin family protein
MAHQPKYQEITMPKWESALALLLVASSPAIAADAPRETVAPAYGYPIANVPGKAITSLIVTYPPGGKTPSHRHGKAFVVGYVLEGSIRSKLNSGEERVYKAGESWTEKPGTLHAVSENASATEPAKLLAVLIHDSKAKDLVTLEQPAGKSKK